MRNWVLKTKIAFLVLACGLTTTSFAQSESKKLEARDPDEVVSNYKVVDQELEGVLTILSEMTGRSILRPQALPTPKITFDSGGEITVGELVLALESLLSLNDIGISPLGERFLKVVPLSEIRTEAPELVTDSLAQRDPSGKIVSKLFRLQHLDSQTFQQQITPFLSPGFSTIIPFQNSNAVIVTDTISNLQRLEYVVGEVDKPSRLNIEPTFYTLQFAQASEVAQQIQQMIEDARSRFGDTNNTANNPGGGRNQNNNRSGGADAPPVANNVSSEREGGSINEILFGSGTAISADDRTNQIIIMTAPSNLQFFEDIIQKLDIKADPSTRIEVIPLKHADATEVASLLSQFVSNRTSSDTNDRTNSRTNSANARDRGTSAGRATFRNANQPNAAPVQATFASSSSSAEDRDSQFSTFMTILADERSNSLVISGTRSDLDLMGALVADIDVLLAQVRIEVVITEVNLNENDGLTRGLDAFAAGYDGDTDGNGTVTLNTKFLGLELSDGSLQFTDGELTNITISTILDTARSNSNVRIVSQPTLTTTHNKEASITVGESRPIITGSQVSSISDNVRSSIQYQDIGITLTVTPLIGPNDVVQLEISQQIDEVTGETVEIDNNEQPVIGRREATSYVSVASGELVVLGGLQRVNVTKEKRKLGIFGQVPVLGGLFSNERDGGRKSELMVFIRPIVVRSTDDVYRDAVDVKSRLKAAPSIDRVIEDGRLDIDGRFEDDEAIQSLEGDDSKGVSPKGKR
ncbi:secretin N-terminal domain-containing protein [Pelagicoccus mobilis]|uniref:Type II secretion system protein GspD n=1 Tax=Pelagicoccus mobilis TaxID=415221 RepID=A0A934RUT1_9BACT|nr:secretin N-terminal domain-containing protein [Pelagicoccus mobilis]MBK1878050.1 hypothetical protein [Pelagicoccus mobilis]